MNTAPDKETRSSPQTDYKYWAFISYSHKDEKWAAWLHRALEHYRVPRSVVGTSTSVGKVPKRLYPIFRDREEFPSSPNLTHEVKEALQQSRNLLVVCSPHAAVSNWVNEEILAFKQLGYSDRIFCLIVDGEPYASDNPDKGELEAFPRAVRLELGPEGELLRQSAQPLAADVRKGKDGERHAKLKLVAGLLDINLSELIKRDKRRRFRQRVIQTAGVLVVLAVILGIWWLGKQRTSVEAQRADEQTRVVAMRTLASRAKAMFEQEPARLRLSMLLAIEAIHRAIALRQPADEAFDVVRRGLALFPRPTAHSLEHWEPATEVAYSHDGHWLATLDGKRLRLWDTTTGKQDDLSSLPGDGVSLAFSRDDQRLLTVSNNAVQIWDPISRKKIAEKPYHDELSYNTVLSPDGMLLASTGDFAYEVVIWEAATGRRLRKVKTEVGVTSMAFSPNGRLLVTGVGGQGMTGAIDPGIQLWDVNTGRDLARYPHEAWVDTLAFSPDSRLVATNSGTTIRIFDTAAGKQVGTFTYSVTDETAEHKPSLAFGVDGRWLAATAGTTVHVWEVVSRHEVARIPDTEGVVTFSPDGSQLLTADGRLWEMNTGEQLSRLTTSKGALAKISLGARGLMLTTTGVNGGVNVRDVSTGRLVGQLPENWIAGALTLASNGQYMATSRSQTIGDLSRWELWEVRTGRMIGKVWPDANLSDVAMHPEGRYFVTGDDDGNIVRYSTANAAAIDSVKLKGSMSIIEFSHDGETMALGNDAGDVWLRHPSSEKQVLLGGSEKTLSAIAFTLDDRYVGTGSGLGSVVLWDVSSGKETLRKSFKEGVRELSFSADGRRAVTVTEFAVYVWETTNGEDIAAIRLESPKFKDKDGKEHTGEGVTDVTLSEDGQWLAIAWHEQSNSGLTLSIWHAPTGRKLATLARDVRDLEVGTDGPRMATLTNNGVQVEFWDPQRLIEEACARVGRDLTEQERQMYFAGEKYQPTCRQLVVPL